VATSAAAVSGCRAALVTLLVVLLAADDELDVVDELDEPVEVAPPSRVDVAAPDPDPDPDEQPARAATASPATVNTVRRDTAGELGGDASGIPHHHRHFWRTFRPMALASLPDDTWVADVGEVPGVEVESWDVHESYRRAADLNFVVPPYLDSGIRLDLLGSLPRLSAVQLLTAGYETVLPHIPDGVQLCNGAGIHDASTAELTLTLILASLRGVPDFVSAQSESRWLPTRIWPALADRRVLIVGYGHVGRAIVQRLLPFEVEVSAVASRARAGDELVAQVHGIDELSELLPTHDVVVLIVPLSEATTGLVDREFLATMKDGALLVNVSRGQVVDTEALLAEARSGRLTAALDVTDPEPLPADHALWRTRGVLISPHVGGASTAFRPRAVAVLRRQLKAFGAGQPLEHVVTN
jgi:phosphoglycerate dehydrogenase-like enzyme